MWTAKETARALRGEKAAILRDWSAEAQTRLWHVEKALLTRKGAATRCARDTLTMLADYHQAREARQATALPSAGRSRAKSAPQDAGGAAAPVEEGTTEEALAEAPAGAATPEPTLDRLTAPCAEAWAALALAWADIRMLLEILAGHTLRILAAHGADPDTLALEEGLFAALAAAIADRHITQLEQQAASFREEYSVTQHLAGRFLANTSHELRTPITAILGFAELLLEETYGTLNPEQRAAVGHIENSAQNLLEVINNLLDLLRIRAGKLALQYRPVAVTPLLRHLYEILQPLANRKGVGFSMELPDNLGAIEADENILRHVIYHLLASALRATPTGGEVALRAHRDDGTLTILTQDTALHFPPEAIANMTDPFPRLENSPARGYEGWEVGLPLVRRYVELHEGKLELESAPEQGTTFRILLPTTRGARPISL